MKIKIERETSIIFPNNNRVIARFFFIGEERAEKVIDKILKFSEIKARNQFNQILREFSLRHRSISKLFQKHYNNVKYIVEKIHPGNNIPEWCKLLIGSYFTMEYAIESAAIFNPSVVEDPDQSGLSEGEMRLIISLRATGEGHISSLIFRGAVLSKDNKITLAEPGNMIDEAIRIKDHLYKKESFISKLKNMKLTSDFCSNIIEKLPSNFSYDEIRSAVLDVKEHEGSLSLEKEKSINEIEWLAESYTEIKFSFDTDISERVIFPISKFEKNGIEDARFVKFTKDNGDTVFFATYTAYDGYTVLPKLIKTKDFYTFKIFPLRGKFATNKNLALFPRKINGKYAMLSRIDGINNYLMLSDNLYEWNNATLIEEPKYLWELMQIGNGGSPIETDKGWLLITHGVGPVRKYCLGACLLDLDDPTKITGRLKEPLLLPDEKERAGYVPNVVYTCGTIVHNHELIIPYAMSDYASGFAKVNLDQLLDLLTENPS
ncbi:MAG: glycoside hydrolase family 130 protein [Prolixibacteraceae bacterium]|nr:glycoside hydrolase family 130 protein [Prolixibacteraceae bacterium]